MPITTSLTYYAAVIRVFGRVVEQVGDSLNSSRRIAILLLRPLPFWRQGVLHVAFDCCTTFSAPPSHANQEGGTQDPWMREAEHARA